MKKISLNALEAILAPKEMKKLLGGGSYLCSCNGHDGTWECWSTVGGSDCDNSYCQCGFTCVPM